VARLVAAPAHDGLAGHGLLVARGRASDGTQLHGHGLRSSGACRGAVEGAGAVVLGGEGAPGVDGPVDVDGDAHGVVELLGLRGLHHHPDLRLQALGEVEQEVVFGGVGQGEGEELECVSIVGDGAALHQPVHLVAGFRLLVDGGELSQEQRLELLVRGDGGVVLVPSPPAPSCAVEERDGEQEAHAVVARDVGDGHKELERLDKCFSRLVGLAVERLGPRQELGVDDARVELARGHLLVHHIIDVATQVLLREAPSSSNRLLLPRCVLLRHCGGDRRGAHDTGVRVTRIEPWHGSHL